jgi:ParB-like chromosome segregation protein Spo0J
VKKTTVSLDRVLWRNRRFTFTVGGDTRLLETSIGKRGLLHPPDLLSLDGRYVIIRGSRRLRILRRLGSRKVAARVFSPREISPFDAWSMNFHDNLSVRSLNPAEACTVLRQLTDLGVGAEEIVKDYLPLLGLPPRSATLEECLPVAALDGSVLKSLARGEVTLATAAFCARLSASDRAAAFRFLRRRPLTVSQQREWTRLLADLSARDGRQVAAILASAARAARGKTGSPGAAALQVLRERRYPALAARRKDFRALVRRLRLPPWFHLETHPYFERDELNVRFSARDRSSWEKALTLLSKIDEDPVLSKLLNPAVKKRKKG